MQFAYEAELPPVSLTFVAVTLKVSPVCSVTIALAFQLPIRREARLLLFIIKPPWPMGSS